MGRRRVARLSLAAGAVHVATSLFLGAAVIGVGLQLKGVVAGGQRWLVGSLLVVTGAVLAVLELRGGHHQHGHHHHHHPHHHHHDRPPGRLRSRVAILAAFGAAASPDLTILPVLLAAGAIGGGVAAASLLCFAVATIATFVGLTLLSYAVGGLAHEQLLARFGGYFIAAVLVAVGAAELGGLL